MTKPTSVVRKEFIDDLRALVQNSHLPPYVVAPIVEDLKKELDMATEQQYRLDYMEYQKSLESGDESAAG